DYELTARARNGTETVVSYNATTFHDRDRCLQGVFAAARDVTELKRFERTLQQKNAELEDANRMKSEFLANMSHELRTPLNAIIGFSEVLKDGLLGDMTDQQRGFIGDIFNSGKHLLLLINDILDLSKVEAGKMLLDLEVFPVAPLLQNSLSIVREKAAARRISVSMQVDELGSMNADSRKLKQIVYNLLSNAVKFSADGGQVTLSAKVVPRAQVGKLAGPWVGRTCPLAEGDAFEFLELSVSDTGIGISAEGLEKLFQPFSQIDSGLARKFEGTGLGLAMVKLLAELHGGSVAAESAVGEGSRFTVWLPFRAFAETNDAERSLRRRSNLPPGIPIALIVEHDLKSAELIRLQLEADGFGVLHASTAEAAIAIARNTALSLITLEIMLPDVDGWDFLARLKKIPELCAVPVVIISIVADRNRGFALGAAAVLEKPISRQELIDALTGLGLYPVSRGKQLSVLVVDDDPAAVELIAVRLAELEVIVERAYGGREGIAAAQRCKPDLIVLDLMMPDVNGFDVVEELRRHAETGRIPIMVLTAMQLTNEERRKLNGHVTAVLAKTELELEHFRAEVRRAMSHRKQAA
ncbi:MAG TPA: response regulator, partial [Polyangiaceae bacterium]